MGVGIGKDSGLKHLVRRPADPRDDIGRAEGGLFHLGKVILWIAVELKDADILAGIICVGPDLGQIKRVEAKGFRLKFGC